MSDGREMRFQVPLNTFKRPDHGKNQAVSSNRRTCKREIPLFFHATLSNTTVKMQMICWCILMN